MIRLRELVPGVRDVPRLVVLAVAFAAATWLGLKWAIAPGGGSPIWPAAGIGFAGLVLGGPQLWPALFVGRLAVAVIAGSSHSWWIDLLLALNASASPLASTLIIRRLGGLDPRLGSLRDIARLILLGGGLGSLISSLGVLALWTPTLAPDRLLPILQNWTFAYIVGVLLVAPLALALSRWREWRPTPEGALHLAACLAATSLVAFQVFLRPAEQPVGSWEVFPILAWAALAFSVWGASLSLLLIGLVAAWAATRGLWPDSQVAIGRRVMMAQEFLGASGLTSLVLAAVADERRAKDQIAASERRLLVETEALETLNATGALIAADLDVESVVQKVIDAGSALTGAAMGAFFYRVHLPHGPDEVRFVVAGARQVTFERLGLPGRTAVFLPTLKGEAVVRSADITKDPRHGKKAPHFGQPKGHPPVRSYLAVSVKSHSGEVLGGLLFGHPQAGVFDERAERVAVGLAGQAAIALDNARLFQAAQREIAERTRAEEHQRLLINELNHRVKNTLATVQSLAAQTRPRGADPRASYEAFIERLMALSRAHDVLTHQRWEGADLRAIVEEAVRPFGEAGGGRFEIGGPSVWLGPQTALALAMALHELATNAVKYGALSVPEGQVALEWKIRPDGDDGPDLELAWREMGGPPVSPPAHKGFGSRLLERGLAGELNGQVTVDYRPTGLVCLMQARLRLADRAAQEAAE